MGKPVSVREWEDALYQQALSTIESAEDKSVRETDLENALAALIEIDVEKERHRRAKDIISSRAKPGSTDPMGQLILPGFDAYPYEPQRLIRDNAGRVVENQNATPKFKQAEARRAREHAKEAQAWADRKTEESEHFSAWATEQALRGRPALDLSFGNCINESGVWQPTQPSSGAHTETSHEQQPTS